MHYLLIFSFTITNTYYFGVNKVNIVCYCFIECDFETCMRITYTIKESQVQKAIMSNNYMMKEF